MALKTIAFTVGVNEIKPATIQDGGIQGDHKKTELRFDFNDELYNHLQIAKNNGRLVYRFDATDGEGTVHRSDTADLTGRRVSYPLEYTVTCHGGLVKVELIITLVNGEESTEVLHTKVAELKLTFAPYSTGDKSQFHKDLSTLAEIVKDYAKRAEKAEKAAKEAQEQTDLLSTALNSGTTFIFSGGNASSEVDANFVIDGQMSDYSNNAVANSVAKKYVDDKYPVGSVWVGGKNGDTPIDPSTIFGGEWKLIDKGFSNSSISYEEGGIPKTYFNVPEDSKTKAINLYCSRSGQTIRLRLGITSEETFIDEGEVVLGYINYEALGFKKLPFGYNYTLAATDYANGVLMVNIQWETGAVTVNDVLGKAEISSEYKGTYYPFYIDVTFTVTPERMINSFCDKFYWQRKELKENDYE